MAKRPIVFTRKIFVLAVASFAAANALGAPAQPPRADSQTADPIVPREVFFSRPAVLTPLLSPNGRFISAVRPLNGVLNYFVAPVSDVTAWRPVTHYTKRDVRSTDVSASLIYFWTHDGRYLVFLRDNNGNEKFHVMRVDVKTGDLRDLTPGDGTRAVICQRPAGYLGCEPGSTAAGKILVGLYDDPKFFNLYMIDVATGARKLIFKNDRFIVFVADRSYAPRLGVSVEKTGYDTYLRGPKGWTLFKKSSFGDIGSNRVIGFNSAGNKIFSFSADGRDTKALVEIDLKTKAATVLAEDPQFDLEHEIMDPRTGSIQGYERDGQLPETMAIDPAIEPSIDFLKRSGTGAVYVLSRANDDTSWLVQFAQSSKPPAVYLFAPKTMRLTKLFGLYPKLEGMKLPKTYPIVTKSSDGFTLISYLTLPDGSDLDKQGKLAHPVPLIVWIHGGPSDERAEMPFSPFVHWANSPTIYWLNSRGYAVFNVNYRGSPGFGKKFMAAQNLEWGGKMNRDVDEQVEHLVADGVAEPKRIAAFGGSYGGLATLTAITSRPDLYACGAALAGPSNLQTFLHDMPPEWSVDEMAARLGDPRTPEGIALLHEHSPVYHVDRAKGAVLITAGANDRRVTVSQATEMVNALTAHHVPVTYLLYPDEGHGVLRVPNVESYDAITEAFFAKCLGGRSQGLGETVQHSSVTVPDGADLIPGLSAALTARDHATKASSAVQRSKVN